MNIKRALAFLLTLAMLFTLAPMAFAEEKYTEYFYVDSINGDDANDGSTPETAFKTLYKAFARTFKPGTHVLFRRGGEYEGGWSVMNALITSSGTADNPIVLGAYGDGTNPVITTQAEEWLLAIQGSYITLQDLDFTAPNGAGLIINAVNGDIVGITIESCRFYNIYNVKLSESDLMHLSLLCRGDPEILTRVHDCTFTDIEIFDCAYGIEVMGDSIEDSGSSFTSPEEAYNYNLLFDGIYCHDIWCGGLVLGSMQNCVVRNSRFINCAKTVPFAVAPIWTHHCDNVTIEYCEIAGSTNLIDGMAIDFDGWTTNCTYRYIYSHDNNRFMKNCVYDGTTKNRGNTVDHCLSVNDNRMNSFTAMPCVSSNSIKVNKTDFSLVMDDFTFTNNYIIHAAPMYFGNLTNATITGNYFGGRTIVTGVVSPFWSIASSTCTGTVRDNTFFLFASPLRFGNRLTLHRISAETAYSILFPNGVHT